MVESSAGDTPARLLELLAWFSPAMPTGAFSYSHGLEWAVEGIPPAGAAAQRLVWKGVL